MSGVPARLLTTHVEAHLDELESLLPLRAAADAGRHWTLPRVLEGAVMSLGVKFPPHSFHPRCWHYLC